MPCQRIPLGQPIPGPGYDSPQDCEQNCYILWKCENNTCTTTNRDLCNPDTKNGCPWECDTTEATFTGQNEQGPQPSALVCCSDIGLVWGFSQGFLDEQDWSEPWCSGYVNPTCGYMPVTDLTRCQYLMAVYGPTESGDYCDRIELYVEDAYNPMNLNCP